MLSFKCSLFHHVKWLRKAAAAVGADLVLAGDSIRALLRREGRYWTLHPLFLGRYEDGTRHTTRLDDETEAFEGWVPDPLGAGPVPTDPLAFRRLAAASGLPVPAWHVEAAPELADVVVRRTISPFRPSIVGPFRRAGEHPLDPSEGEFYEAFVPGDAVTVWFWNAEPICAERAPMPSVAGDGISTARELLLRHAAARRIPAFGVRAWLAEREVFLRYHGVAPSDVLPAGARQVVDLSDPGPVPPRACETLDLRAGAALPWLPILRRAGERLAPSVPERARVKALFAIEAVLDGAERPWLVGIDGNPVVHPLVYPALVADLVRAGGAELAAPGAPPSGAAAEA